LGFLQAITALAHLRAAVLYVIDLSEQCGYSLEQQAALFHSLKPLFTNKPVVIVANKIDVTAFDSLSDEQRSLVEGMASEALRLSHGGVTLPGGAAGLSEATLLFMSTVQGAVLPLSGNSPSSFFLRIAPDARSLSDKQRPLVEGMASEALRLRGYCVKGCWPLGGGSALHEHPSRCPSAVLLCAGEAPRYVWEASTV
jgi:hypothetical protein